MTQRYELITEYPPGEKGPEYFTGTWTLPIADEVEVIKNFHETTIGTGKETGNQVLLYRDGKRFLRIAVRDFSDYDEKYNAFGNAFMGIPVFAPHEAILFSDVWTSRMQLEANTDGDILESNLVSASGVEDRKEGIIVAVVNAHGFEVAVLPYTRHDGLITWGEDVQYFPFMMPDLEAEVPIGLPGQQNTIKWMTATGGTFKHTVSESYLTRMLYKAMATPKPIGVSESTVRWLLEKQGFSLKDYVDDDESTDTEPQTASTE